jgi:hypothetical protein
VGRIRLAERRRFPDKAGCIFQPGKPFSGGLKPPQPQLTHASVVRRMRSQRRLCCRGGQETAERLFVFFVGVETQRRLQMHERRMRDRLRAVGCGRRHPQVRGVARYRRVNSRCQRRGGRVGRALGKRY